MPNGNGFPSPKALLMANLALPKSIESTMPGLPALSGVMSTIASQLPDIPGAPGAQALGGLVPPDLFKSIEATLPGGLPKLSAAVGPAAAAGFRQEPPVPKGVRLLGQGYRSI